LNRLNILNRFKTEVKPCPGTVLVGPTCRCPAAALARFSLFLPHPAADHRAPLPPGPTCLSRSAASPTPRRSPLFMQQRCHLPPTAEGCCRPHPSSRAVDRCAQGPLSPISFPPRGTKPTPPPLTPQFPSHSSLRARQYGEDVSASLRSIPHRA
jgi:hypothetical protein